MTLDDATHDGLSNDDEPDGRTETLEIAIANQQTDIFVDERPLMEVSRQILQDAGFARGELSIAIVDDDTMHALNREYLDHDYPTDVLSFPLECQGDWFEGEIIVSADTAAQEAAEVGWETATEMMLYVIHGTLHLVGHDDHDPEARQAMRRAERKYLESMGLHLSDVDRRLPDVETDDEADWREGSWPTNDDSEEETE